jgi:hypothetical protein
VRHVPGPPRLARWILERALPDDVREDVSGDLRELFQRRCVSDGAVRSRLWYWRQAFSFTARFRAERMRGRNRHTDMSTGISWIDFRLAVRMLVRYPGLTLVGVLGMAVGITIATAAFTIVFALLDPTVPLQEGDRVVSIVNWDAATNNREQRSMRDYATWREDLASLQISAAVDPNLQLRNISSAEDALRREQGIMRLIGLTLAVVMLSVVVLSAAGIYALMSFTVARCRKEIGIRAALGADPSRILAGIFSRAFAQLAIGAGLGFLGAVGLEQLLEGEMFQGHGAVILPLVAVFMTIVGLLAAVGPARRGLQIQPIEALREE